MDTYKFARYLMLDTILKELELGKLQNLQELWEHYNKDNSRLTLRLLEKRYINASPQEIIFTDMAFILFEESETTPSILSSFKELYSQKYTRPVLSAKAWLQTGNFGTTKNTLEKTFETFLLVWPKCYVEKIYDISTTLKSYESDYQSDDHFLNYQHMTYKNGTAIYGSKAYEHFISRHKKRLVDYLQVTYKDPKISVDNLSAKLSNLLRSKADNSCTHLPQGPASIAAYSAVELLLENNGGLIWYTQVTNKKYLRPNTQYLDYQPDIDTIISLYYKCAIRYETYRYKQNQDSEGFTPPYIRKEFWTSSAEVDFIAISYMYNLEIVYKLFSHLLETYYRNFSFEKLFDENIATRYAHIIEKLEKQTSEHISQIESLENQNCALKKQLLSSGSDDALNYERELSKHRKSIEQKNNEILFLQEQLRSKEQYIELLLTPEPEPPATDIDLSSLQGKKYLFVCSNSKMITNLRQEFPNSIYMDTDRFSLTGIQVDAVVFMTKLMSHSMFYKVSSTDFLKEKPQIYCNTKNIKAVFAEMNKVIL